MTSVRRTITYKQGDDKMYIFGHSVNPNAREVSYNPETHISVNHGLEIFLLLKGEIDFLIENSTYPLSARDILLINETEVHTLRSVRDSEYERITLHIFPSFFEKYGVADYKKVFYERVPGRHNRIRGYSPEGEQLYALFMKMERYIQENPTCDKVIDAVLIEILYLLNSASLSEGDRKKVNETVAGILRYINEHLSDSLTLNEIAETFYISKYHLCHIFKKSTGFSIKDYIIQKRILLVQSLCQNGMRISEAAAQAGFGNYSNFYRIYVDRTGHSPSKTLKTQI
ncbi:MAG: helix-turn-helix transcriptional regulator [Clostridia bacterium]|nr:helix-turn-helix transcriptional regulator [Clostridia bacterium]